MKKSVVFLILCVWMSTVSFASNANSMIQSDENISVDISDGYTNDIIYNENYDYNLGYDSDDITETMSLKGKVVFASEPYEHDNGYVKSLAQKLKVEIIDSRHKGEVYDIVYYLEDDYNTKLPKYDSLKVNDKVYVYANYEDEILVGEAYVQYYDKTGWILLIVVFFAALILFIGGKQGVKALLGLIITIALIFGILIPGIISSREPYTFLNSDGSTSLNNNISWYQKVFEVIQKNPIALTTIVCCLIIFITFIIISGFHKKTFAAICGTIAGVVAAGVIGSVFSNLMMINGINEDARMLSVSVSENQNMFDFEGIMLVGIMISALGACMDVGMSIASAVSELKSENPEMTANRLIRSGMNIGKDVMGTMTNTLILAYVGSAMLCILLYSVNGFNLSTVLNQDDIAMEVLKSLAGSIGLVCTIPFTAIVSGLIMGTDSETPKNTKSIKDDDKDEVKVRYFKG